MSHFRDNRHLLYAELISLITLVMTKEQIERYCTVNVSRLPKKVHFCGLHSESNPIHADCKSRKRIERGRNGRMVRDIARLFLKQHCELDRKKRRAQSQPDVTQFNTGHRRHSWFCRISRCMSPFSVRSPDRSRYIFAMLIRFAQLTFRSRA